jgi:hypothetical protein
VALSRFLAQQLVGYFVSPAKLVPITRQSAQTSTPRRGKYELGRYQGAVNGYAISGTVKIDVIVGQRMVRLYERQGGDLLAQQMSGQDGTFFFDWIDAKYKYMVVGWDQTNTYNSVVFDNITPVAF